MENVKEKEREKKKAIRKAPEATLEYGQIAVTILGEKYKIPFKIRISGNFIPDVTIDPRAMKERYRKTRGFDLMSIIQPRVAVLIGNQAFEIDHKGDVRKIDPRIFERPTTFDRLAEAGAVPLLIFVGGVAFFLYKMLTFLKEGK